MNKKINREEAIINVCDKINKRQNSAHYITFFVLKDIKKTYNICSIRHLKRYLLDTTSIIFYIYCYLLLDTICIFQQIMSNFFNVYYSI